MLPALQWPHTHGFCGGKTNGGGRQHYADRDGHAAAKARGAPAVAAVCARAVRHTCQGRVSLHGCAYRNDVEGAKELLQHDVDLDGASRFGPKQHDGLHNACAE
jgi:hypothetical protein